MSSWSLSKFNDGGHFCTTILMISASQYTNHVLRLLTYPWFTLGPKFWSKHLSLWCFWPHCTFAWCWWIQIDLFATQSAIENNGSHHDNPYHNDHNAMQNYLAFGLVVGTLSWANPHYKSNMSATIVLNRMVLWKAFGFLFEALWTSRQFLSLMNFLVTSGRLWPSATVKSPGFFKLDLRFSFF